MYPLFSFKLKAHMNPTCFDKNNYKPLIRNFQSAFKLEPILHKPAAPIISDEKVKEVLAQRGQKKNPVCARCQARNVRCDRKKPCCSQCIKIFAKCIYKGGHKPVKQEQASPQLTLPKINVPPEYVPLYDITPPPLDPSRITTHLKRVRHV